MAKTFIRFQLHKARTNKEGYAPIKVVLHLNQSGKPVERRFIPTDKKIRPENWKDGKAVFLNKSQAKKVLPSTPYTLLPLQKDIDLFNADLGAIEKQLRAIEGVLNFEGENYTLLDIIVRYKAKNEDAPQIVASQPKIYISDFIEDYINRSNGLVNEGTLKTYGSLLAQLKSFGSKKQDRLTFAYLDKYKLDDLLKHYIKCGYNNSYTSKHFSILKKMIRLALAETPNLEVNQAFRDYNPTVLRSEDNTNDVISLEQDEFNSILDIDLSDYAKKVSYTKVEKGVEKKLWVSYKTLDKVRNLFLMSCSTGFRFSDLADLKREHIQGDWIRKRQVKGGKVYRIEIPLNAISNYILSLYEKQIKPLPAISNQKANDYLKIIGELAGIKAKTEITTKIGTETISESFPKYELMSMHMGRRVFTSLSLAKGVGMQDVMSLTGHKKFASFKRYMNISAKQKQKAMSVWGEVKQNDNPLKIAQ